MPDPFSGDQGTDPQSLRVLEEAAKRSSFRKPKDSADSARLKEGNKRGTKKKSLNSGALYEEGCEELKKHGILLELCSEGSHCNHKVYSQITSSQGLQVTDGVKSIKGITYPRDFSPKVPINHRGVNYVDSIISTWSAPLQEFWRPLFKDKKGGDLENYTNTLLRAKNDSHAQNLHDPLFYDQTFDPTGSLTGKPSSNDPKTWVPAREWFDESLRKVEMKDVFTLFPRAELEILSLILGRVAVGRSNHIPSGWSDPVKHTYRTAGVIVGKDPGTGKSILFNNLTSALSRCGFSTASFKSTVERFGLKNTALADIAYKDDTSIKSLKDFLSSEETKILVTGGLFSVEEKFARGEQIWPRCVILLNSNAWSNNFSYDLDPGIIDRVKLLSTYRRFELERMPENMTGVSEGSPNAFPESHIPWLAEKLGVDEEALYLWCIRLCADKFWNVISDKSEPSVNRLEREIKWWTTRLRIKFKADVRLSMINAMVIAAFLRRQDGYVMTELSSTTLMEHLRDLHFIGTDPSCQDLMVKMKKRWEEDGRSSVHYYSGIREIRMDTLESAMKEFPDGSQTMDNSRSEVDIVRDAADRIITREGFKPGLTFTYLSEDWSLVKHCQEELKEEAERLLEGMDPLAVARIRDEKAKPEKDWMYNRYYSPDLAEEYRGPAWEEMKARLKPEPIS